MTEAAQAACEHGTTWPEVIVLLGFFGVVFRLLMKD